MYRFSDFPGPTAPVQPVALRFVNTSHSAATLEWRIPEIAYDPEIYRVEFGTMQTILNRTSIEVAGSNELTTTNQRYTVELNDLLSETTYYYRVVSTNSYASTSSAVASFVTTQLRMFRMYDNKSLTL